MKNLFTLVSVVVSAQVAWSRELAKQLKSESIKGAVKDLVTETIDGFVASPLPGVIAQLKTAQEEVGVAVKGLEAAYKEAVYSRFPDRRPKADEKGKVEMTDVLVDVDKDVIARLVRDHLASGNYKVCRVERRPKTEVDADIEASRKREA